MALGYFGIEERLAQYAFIIADEIAIVKVPSVGFDDFASVSRFMNLSIASIVVLSVFPAITILLFILLNTYSLSFKPSSAFTTSEWLDFPTMI